MSQICFLGGLNPALVVAVSHRELLRDFTPPIVVSLAIWLLSLNLENSLLLHIPMYHGGVLLGGRMLEWWGGEVLGVTGGMGVVVGGCSGGSDWVKWAPIQIFSFAMTF